MSVRVPFLSPLLVPSSGPLEPFGRLLGPLGCVLGRSWGPPRQSGSRNGEAQPCAAVCNAGVGIVPGEPPSETWKGCAEME
eukprot:3550809-Pyramimonas_sp.AAC.1